jgi:hypothetical protein
VDGEITGRRRLIVCCDGTWNKPDREGHTTNVVRMVRSIKTESVDGIPQIVYYHPGVGTGNFFDRLIGGSVGVGLSENVRSGYAFILNNYRDGDEIFLFGFSRGAYTVRSIAGIIGHVGLLRKHHMESFDAVWDYYCLPVDERDKVEQAFLKNFSDRVTRDDVNVRCIGVWDTVGALGIPDSRFCQNLFSFHDTNLGPRVEHAYQALAIDEERCAFEPAIWKPCEVHRPDQVLEQVWFPGVHSNIGGGYKEHGLSDAAFLWMAAKVAPLLTLDLDYICALAQREVAYSKGKLQKTLSLRWRLISLRKHLSTFGSCARDMCTTDPSERIHESVWLRMDPSSGSPHPLTHRNKRFAEFLRHHESRKAILTPFEKDILARVARTPPEKVVTERFRDPGFCDRLVKILGG